MRKFLLLPALGWSSAVFAQSDDCSAIKAENVVLKDKIVAYEARLGIGVGGVAVEDGDPAIKVKFLSCKASKATHRAVLNFLVVNSGEPLVLEIESLTASNRPSQVVDEQGRAFTATSAYYPTVGGRQLKAASPPTVPLTCTITCEEVPLATISSECGGSVLSTTESRYDWGWPRAGLLQDDSKEHPRHLGSLAFRVIRICQSAYGAKLLSL